MIPLLQKQKQNCTHQETNIDIALYSLKGEQDKLIW